MIAAETLGYKARCVLALLRKEGEGRTSPFPKRTYPTGSVKGMPIAV